MFIFGKVADKYYPATFHGTICILVHPTSFGHNLQTKTIGKYPFSLDLWNLCGRFTIESIFL